MSWATKHIALLTKGETVQFRPFGGSMAGLIESGQLVTVAPVEPESLNSGDIVLCKVGRAQYLHLVKKISNGKFLIGNNKGRVNGWIGCEAIYGRCIKVEA